MLLAIGLNHKSAPLSIREQVAFTAERLTPALYDLRTRSGISEAAILSTCNRTELYCGIDHGDNRRIVDWLSRYHSLSSADLNPYIYQHPDQYAVRHMFRVAAGLDSMVLGEPQILGQVKTAYQTASRSGMLGSLLERLFQQTFAVAKQVRTDTAIGAHPISVAFAAVNLSQQIFTRLEQQTALLIGAGSTMELVAHHLYQHGIGRMIVANRTLSHAHAVAAPFGGHAIALDDIPQHLAEAEIVISSTASPNVVLDFAAVKRSLMRRRRRPMFMVDIAVPRDIDPMVARLEDIYLYTIDDLQVIVQDNIRFRQTAAEQAEAIVARQTEQFMSWLRSHNSAGSIRALRQQAETTRDAVLKRARQQLDQGRNPEQVLEFLANTLTNKLLHRPSVGLREAAAAGDDAAVTALRRLYQLD